MNVKRAFKFTKLVQKSLTYELDKYTVNFNIASQISQLLMLKHFKIGFPLKTLYVSVFRSLQSYISILKGGLLLYYITLA